MPGPPRRDQVGILRLALMVVVPVAACDGGSDLVQPSSSTPAVGYSRVERAGSVPTVVCHRTNGRAAYLRIRVDERSVPAHLRHGDGLEGSPVPGQPGMIFDEDCMAVPALMLLAPAPGEVLDNGCSVAPDLIEWDFDWSDVPGAERYHLYVKGPTATIPLIDDMFVPGSQYAFERLAYIIDQNRLGWTWRVRAFVAGEWGEWTEVRTFDVEPLNTDCT